MPSRACCTCSASWPSTTITASTPALDTRPTTRRTSGSPSSSMKSLFRPMRVDVPAANTTPATVPARSGMNRWPFLAQVSWLLARENRQQLADDADGDLFGTVGAQTQADRSEHARIVGDANFVEHGFSSSAGAEHAD